MTVQAFRKKPVEIEAVQLTDNWSEVCDWINETYQNPDTGAFDTRGAYLPGGPDCDIAIRTLEGEMRAVPGDWIIRGVEGEFYPCKPDIFAATYDASDDAEWPPEHMSPQEHYRETERLLNEGVDVRQRISNIADERARMKATGPEQDTAYHDEIIAGLTARMDELGKKAMGIWAQAQVHATLATVVEWN